MKVARSGKLCARFGIGPVVRAYRVAVLCPIILCEVVTGGPQREVIGAAAKLLRMGDKVICTVISGLRCVDPVTGPDGLVLCAVILACAVQDNVIAAVFVHGRKGDHAVFCAFGHLLILLRYICRTPVPTQICRVCEFNKIPTVAITCTVLVIPEDFQLIKVKPCQAVCRICVPTHLNVSRTNECFAVGQSNFTDREFIPTVRFLKRNCIIVFKCTVDRQRGALDVQIAIHGQRAAARDGQAAVKAAPTHVRRDDIHIHLIRDGQVAFRGDRAEDLDAVAQFVAVGIAFRHGGQLLQLAEVLRLAGQGQLRSVELGVQHIRVVGEGVQHDDGAFAISPKGSVAGHSAFGCEVAIFADQQGTVVLQFIGHELAADGQGSALGDHQFGSPSGYADARRDLQILVNRQGAQSVIIEIDLALVQCGVEFLDPAADVYIIIAVVVAVDQIQALRRKADQ